MADKPPPKKRGRKPILDRALVAAALVELRGNIAKVADRFKVARQSVRQMIDKSPELVRICKDAREGMIDHAVSSLYRAIIKGEAWAVCFFLKTQGKSRGYIENIDAKEFRQLQKVNAELLDHLKSLRASNAAYEQNAAQNPPIKLPDSGDGPRGDDPGAGIKGASLPSP